MAEEINRTLPYREKLIKDISKDDVKVCISGLIINKNPGNIILDDSTGQITVNIETNLDLNSFVRVFGRVMPYNNMEIYGEIIQDFSKIDKFLYRKVQQLT